MARATDAAAARATRPPRARAHPRWPVRRPLPLKSGSAAAASYAAGDIVEHRVFGRGKVLKATPIAGDCIVEIQFDRVGVKKTMANYAPLKKVEE